jgi:dihydrofolate reductase
MWNIITAYDDNRVIGYKNKLPWHIPEDLEFFKKITMGHTVVMGRRTWESLPKSVRPLPGRRNIVLTKGDHSPIIDQGADEVWGHVISLRGDQIGTKNGNHLFFIGGSRVYKSALSSGHIRNIYVTHVYGVHDGDAFFPRLPNGTSWDVIRQPFAYDYRFERLHFRRK